MDLTLLRLLRRALVIMTVLASLVVWSSPPALAKGVVVSAKACKIDVQEADDDENVKVAKAVKKDDKDDKDKDPIPVPVPVAVLDM